MGNSYYVTNLYNRSIITQFLQILINSRLKCNIMRLNPRAPRRLAPNCDIFIALCLLHMNISSRV